MRLLGFGLCTLGLLLAGCFQQFEEYRQATPPTRPPGAVELSPGPAPEVFPLRPGARYDYVAHFGLGAGFFTGDAALSVLDAYQTGSREIDEVRVVSHYFGRTRRDPYRFVRENGWVGLLEKYPPDKVTFFMPTQLTEGQHWHVETGEGPGEAEVEAIESLRVPAGTFAETYRVRYRNTGASTDITLWLAPQVGLVKADVQIRVSLLPLRGVLELSHRVAPLAPVSGREAAPAAQAAASAAQ